MKLKNTPFCLETISISTLSNNELTAERGIERINTIIFGLDTSTVIPYTLCILKNVNDQNHRNELFAFIESYINGFIMEEKNRKQIRKTGKKPKNNPEIHRYSISLNAEDNAKFFDQSGLKVMAHFITTCIFQKTVKTVKIDMDAIEYRAGLTKFFSQFQGIGTNYNQVVKILYRNFREKSFCLSL